MERKINLPIIMIVLMILCGICACSIASFGIAGSQDGYTLEAFDFGPSPWWWIGIMFFILFILTLFVILLFSK